LPYSWKRVHGPLWKIIIKVEQPHPHWYDWIGVALAITSFFYIGFTSNAREFYKRCADWAYSRSPAKLRGTKKDTSQTARSGGTECDVDLRLVEQYISSATSFLIMLDPIEEEPTKTGLTPMTILAM
jgi:hypothetical protein